MVSVLSSFTLLEQGQAQLLIDVYQRQNNANQRPGFLPISPPFPPPVASEPLVVILLTLEISTEIFTTPIRLVAQLFNSLPCFSAPTTQ